jgi:hypothetical protein
MPASEGIAEAVSLKMCKARNNLWKLITVCSYLAMASYYHLQEISVYRIELTKVVLTWIWANVRGWTNLTYSLEDSISHISSQLEICGEVTGHDDLA